MDNDSERLENIDKLAKSLKDTGLVDSSDKAREMATDMIDKGEESMSEIMHKKHHETLGEKIHDVIKHVEEFFHMKKKDELTEREEAELKEKVDQEKEVKENVKDVVEDLKEEVHEAKEKHDEDAAERLQDDVEEVKEEVEEMEEQK